MRRGSVSDNTCEGSPRMTETLSRVLKRASRPKNTLGSRSVDAMD